MHDVYKANKRRYGQKTTPSLHLQPNQSMKSKRGKEVDYICTLTHSKNMYMKERKIAWSVSSESSKALQFLSFHKVQNRYKGATFQAFFPTKAPHQGLSKFIEPCWLMIYYNLLYFQYIANYRVSKVVLDFLLFPPSSYMCCTLS